MPKYVVNQACVDGTGAERVSTEQMAKYTGEV